MKKLLIALLPTLLIACSTGTSNNTPQSTSYMYVVNRGENAVICNLTNNGQSVTNCNPLTVTGSTINMANIVGITINPLTNVAYIADEVDNIIYDCNINNSNGQLVDCFEAIISQDITRPRPVTVNTSPAGTFVYIATDSKESPGVLICNDFSPNTVANCVYNQKNIESGILSQSPTSVSVNPINAQLIFSVFYGNPATCIVHGLTTVECDKLSIPNYTFWATIDTAISPNNKYAYFTNYGARFVSVCEINQTGGALENCQNSIDIIDGYLYGVYAIALSQNGALAYVSNYDKGIISVCNVAESGTFTSCNALPETFTKPSSIAIYNN